jgi:hypothetical protein
MPKVSVYQGAPVHARVLGVIAWCQQSCQAFLVPKSGAPDHDIVVGVTGGAPMSASLFCPNVFRIIQRQMKYCCQNKR